MSRTPRPSRQAATPARQWRRPEVDPGIKHYPLPVAAFLGAVSAAFISLIICFATVFVVWVLAAHGDESLPQVLRASGAAWLGAHLVPLTIGGNIFGLLPWGFLAVPGILCWKSMHWSLKSAQPSSARGFWLTSFYFTISYVLIASLVCLLSSTRDLFAAQLSTALHSFTIAALLSIAVVIVYAPNRHDILLSLPEPILRGVRPGLLFAMSVYTCGALTMTVMLIIRLREVKSVTWLMAPHIVDAFFLTVLGIGYLPTLAAWATSYVLGPGFALGAASQISIHQANVGRLPAFPALAIVPNQVPRFAFIVILVPIACAVLAFMILDRDEWTPRRQGFVPALANAMGMAEFVSLISAGVVGGVAMGLVMAAAQGPLGSEELKHVGPSPVMTGLSAGGFMMITGVLLFVLPRVFLDVRASQRRTDLN